MTYLIKKFTVAMFVVFLMAGISPTQIIKGQTPVRERLLNQLSVLLWKDASSNLITVSLRIHSGAAFDPLGKEGTASLLTAVMFPDTGIYEDFKEDLGGSLNVTRHYDYLQIDMTASKDKLVPVLEILASAITTPNINKETTEYAKNKELQKLLEDSLDAKYLAKEETAARLFGDFPYGRNVNGTEVSIPEIDFADLIYFKNRFVTADNATLSISGDIDQRYAYIAARRLLGSWQKGDRKIPANFTLPESPDTAPLIVNVDTANWRADSCAVETVGRKAPEYYAAKILSRIYKSRLEPDEQSALDYESFLLRGYFVLTVSRPKVNAVSGEPMDPASGGPLQLLLSRSIGEDEFRAAFAAELNDFKSRDLVNKWFDVDTYSLKSVADELSKLQSVKLKDVASLAAKISKNPIVEVQVIPLEAVSPASTDNSEDPKDPK